MTKCKTVLIVEDDESIREALKLALEFDGYKVETAENGKAGIQRLDAIETPCLILLDLMMPVMDGWEFAEVLKKNSAHAAIPIVVVTAFADRARSISNASKVIRKPVEIETLLKSVNQYCG